MSEYLVPGTDFTIREILKDPKRRMATAENELTVLMADILLGLKISLQEWELLSDRYWRKRYPNDPIKAAQEKTNAARALTMNKITWKRFDEFIQTLGAESFSYKVALTFVDGRTSEHTLKLKNRYKDKVDASTKDIGDESDDDDLRPVGYHDAIKALHEIEFNLPGIEPYLHTYLLDKNDKETGNE